LDNTSPSIPCTICRIGEMVPYHETDRVVLYRCPRCDSVYGTIKHGVPQMPTASKTDD